ADGISSDDLTLASRNDSGLHRKAVACDIPRTREPNLAGMLVAHAMFDRLAQRAQAKRLTDDESVQRQREHQWLFLRGFQQFLELINNHVGEIASGMVTDPERAGIVELHRIWHREQWAGAGLHPDRLVINRPIQEVGESTFLQKIGGDAGFGG